MIKDTIEQKINSGINVSYLEVENESHKHNVPANSETHFKIILVSDDFHGLNKVKQHQAIYGLLSEELAGCVHALALHTYDIQAWEQVKKAPDSPDCLGGSKP